MHLQIYQKLPIFETKDNGTQKMYNIHKDYLDSFETITDEHGYTIGKLSFDPWGRRRNATDWTYDSVPETYTFSRGFTGHEHLDNFDLINMNGRVYAPWLGRMLSPDPVVQAPENSQSYNKYSYAFNNPLKYTDPTGYTMEEWLNTVHNPYRNVIVSNSAHSINARSGFKYGTYRYNEKTGETINTWTGKAVSKQEVLLKMQLVKTGYVSVGFSTGEMVSYNGGEPFPEVVIKPIDVYEAKLKPQFVKANVESQDGEAGGGDFIIGQSFDATIAVASLGYTVEGGFYTDGTNENFKQFTTHGNSYGLEASVGANLIFIMPKENFKFGDLEGMGVSGVINIGPVSLSLLGNSAPGYSENSVAETYWGFKIGLGLGIGGSYTPKSNTTFRNWMPPLPNNIIIWK